MKASLSILFVIVLCASALVAGCASYVPASFEDPGQNPPLSYRFDYTPKADKSLKNPLTMLLVSPTYEVKFPSQYSAVGGSSFSGATTEVLDEYNKIIAAYSNSMGDDFKEMMTKRNFRIIEMLKQKDLATYSQREQSNFSLTPKVVVELADNVLTSEDPERDVAGALLTNKWSAGTRSGKFGMKARIVLEVYEPLTWQLLWVKSIETDPMTKDYRYRWNYRRTGAPLDFAVGSDDRPNALASLLEQSYNEVMDKLYIYLDPDEFTVLSKQAEEVRKKATGIVR